MLHPPYVLNDVSGEAIMIQNVQRSTDTIGSMQVETFAHPQGCRGYILVDPASKNALIVDPHLDLVFDMVQKVKDEGWNLRYVIDTHTHADHPSGAAAVAAQFDSTRVAHEKAGHKGVTLNPKDGEVLEAGALKVKVKHAPGHTPDHMVLIANGALFSGDSLLIGGVARTDFLGGDAGTLFDTIHSYLNELPDDTVLFPGHDYKGNIKSTLGQEKKENPWLQLTDRDEFVKNLIANPPPRPANMDDLLKLNREGVHIPETISAAEASRLVQEGGAVSVIDVRTGAEYQGEHVPGSHLIPLDQIEKRAGEVLAVPAPRLLLCHSGNRAGMAREALVKLNVEGLSVIEGGIGAFTSSGGETVKGKAHMSLERQVHIAAGSLVLIGALASVFINPWFLIISGFVGCGLIFAGITDWCGMGILLSKMPWNKVQPTAGGAATGGTCAASMPGACAANPPAGGTCAASFPPKKDGD